MREVHRLKVLFSVRNNLSLANQSNILTNLKTITEYRSFHRVTSHVRAPTKKSSSKALRILRFYSFARDCIVRKERSKPEEKPNRRGFGKELSVFVFTPRLSTNLVLRFRLDFLLWLAKMP